MLDATSEGIWDWNIATGEVFFSRRWFESLGYAEGELPPRLETWESLVHPDDMPRVQEALTAHLAGRTGVYECENRLRTKSGAWRQNLDRGRVVERDADGNPLRMVGVDVDITERRRADAALEQVRKLESLGLLAGGIAHDFNNLLVCILGNAELIAGELPGDSALHERVAEIEQASQRAAQLTRRLLVYAGKGRLQTRRSNLAELVDETLALTRPAFPSGIAVRHAASRDNPWIDADPRQVREAVGDLVKNAGESYAGGPGEVSVRSGTMHASRAYLGECALGPDLEAGSYAFVEVRDRGSGMDAALLGRIFDPFFTTRALGRGLGLSSALGIARGHAGTLRAESEPGRGTRMRLLLPLATGAGAAVVPVAAAPETRVPAGTILVVDDEVMVRSVSDAMLRRAGFDVVAVGSGPEALRALEERPGRIAAVLLDLSMPGMSGESTFEALRRVRSDLPVLFFSGRGEQDARRAVRGLPRTAFVSKPFSSPALLEKLGRILAPGPRPPSPPPPA